MFNRNHKPRFEPLVLLDIWEGVRLGESWAQLRCRWNGGHTYETAINVDDPFWFCPACSAYGWFGELDNKTKRR